MFVHVCQGHCFRACQRERAQSGFVLFTRVCVITQGPLCISLHKAWSSHLDLTLLSQHPVTAPLILTCTLEVEKVEKHWSGYTWNYKDQPVSLMTATFSAIPCLYHSVTNNHSFFNQSCKVMETTLTHVGFSQLYWWYVKKLKILYKQTKNYNL